MLGLALLFAASALQAQTHLVIVSGLGGEPKFSARFSQLATSLADAAVKRFGIPDSEVVWLGEDSVSKAPHFRGQSTKVNLERVVSRLAQRARSGDQIVFVLIGHGSGEGDDSRISLPGPDPSAADFSHMLARFPTQKVAFVDLTSASGDMLPALAAPNRVVITATKSAFERNETRFAEFFVQALTGDAADVDKDGRVSLLEAFQYAVTETKRLYDTEAKLQSEHAQLDDAGTKIGTNAPDGRTGEGILARRFFLDAGHFATQAGANDPKLSALYGEKFALEEQIASLRLRKPAMAADAYDDALEGLLIQLALKAKDIRAIEGGAQNP